MFPLALQLLASFSASYRVLPLLRLPLGEGAQLRLPNRAGPVAPRTPADNPSSWRRLVCSRSTGPVLVPPWGDFVPNPDPGGSAATGTDFEVSSRVLGIHRVRVSPDPPRSPVEYLVVCQLGGRHYSVAKLAF